MSQPDTQTAGQTQDDLRRHLFAALEGAIPAEDRLRLVALLRARSPEAAAQIDRGLLQEIDRLRQAIFEVQEAQGSLRELLDKLTAAPYFPALYVGMTETRTGPGGIVRSGPECRVVGFGDSLTPENLQPGDEVLLSSERNFITGVSTCTMFQAGDTATFSRYASAGHLILRSRDEEFVALCAATLRGTELRAGDQVRIDRNLGVALEKLERSRGDECFLENTPEETFEDIGGLSREIERLKRAIALHYSHSETTKKYRLRRKKSVLMHGPPGVGKTMTARALANWMAKLSRSGRSRFLSVKPGALNSMWYGQTEQNYREWFRVAREAGAEDPDIPVVMFMDEVDSVAMARGQSLQRVDDRVLNAFMAELNGLEDRGNVVVVTATNRLSALDPALVRPGRLGDLLLPIPRPNRKAAREILGKHLQPDIPYTDGSRDALLDAAISRIFSANGESELAHITFRDGKRRPVRAADLISGAELAAIAQSATEQACLRDAEGGSAGVSVADVQAAVADFFETATRMLTPGNCRHYIDDLPQDVDVVRVEPVVRKVRNPHRYVNHAA